MIDFNRTDVREQALPERPTSSWGESAFPSARLGLPERSSAERFSRLKPAAFRVDVRDLRSLTDVEVQGVVRMLAQYGCALISPACRPSGPDELLALSRDFGAVVRHRDSDDSGITTITPRPTEAQHWGSSRIAQPPHTDGMYLRHGPPRLLALLAEQIPPVGGRTVLTSGEALYRELRALGPKVLAALFSRDALQVTHDSHVSLRPVLRRLALGQDSGLSGEFVGLAFRSGRFAGASSSEDARPGVQLIRRFVSDPKNQLVFAIPEGSVLLVTNTGRVLHGREGWSKQHARKVHRLWLDGRGVLTPFEGAVFGIPACPEQSVSSRDRRGAR